MAPAIALRPWLLLLPPVLRLVYDTPENTGLRPDGDAAPTQEQGPSALDRLALRAALRTPTFSLLTAGWLAVSMLVTTLHFYQVSILTLQGIEAEIAARVFPLSALTRVLTMPLVGRMFDRFHIRFVFVCRAAGGGRRCRLAYPVDGARRLPRGSGFTCPARSDRIAVRCRGSSAR